MELREAELGSITIRMASQTPVLAILASRGELWASGLGAIAHRPIGGDEWQLCSPTPTLRAAFSLAEGGTTVFAGGVGGVVRSADGGVVWTHGAGTESHTVLCLAVSPEYGHQDETILAGTATHGVLRSSDGGVSWSEARFGLQAEEVSGLIWMGHQTVLANTPEGVFRSTNGGRSWRLLGHQFFLLLCRAADKLFAIDAQGGLWQSETGGEQWSTRGALPGGVESQAFAATSAGEMLVGTVGHGLLLTSDGETWSTCGDDDVLSFTVADQSIYAGTETRVVAVDVAGGNLRDLGSPPLADYGRVLAREDGIFVSGVLASPQRWSEADEWQTLTACPLPLKRLIDGWDGELLAITADGLHASTDSGETWHQRASVIGGDLVSIRSDGAGWMAAADGSHLLITHDRGHTWASQESPFGVFRIVALEAVSQPEGASVLAVTFDARQQSTTLWRSYDDGMTWERGREAYTSWPEVSTLSDPLAVSLGDAIILQGPDGVWMRTQPSQGSFVRRMAASTNGVVALTRDGVWLLRANDSSWRAVPDVPDHVLDVCLDEGKLVVLAAGGEVQIRSVVTP